MAQTGTAQITWGAAWKQYLSEHCATQHKASATRRAAESVAVFARWLAAKCQQLDFPLEEATRDRIEEWGRERKLANKSPATINGDFGKIRAFLRWCWSRPRWLPEDPCRGLKFYRVSKKFPAYWTHELVREFVDHLRRIHRTLEADYVDAVVNTGGRPDEILTLMAEDVDEILETVTFRLREYTPKDNEERVVPLNRPAMAALRRRLIAVRRRGFLFTTRNGRAIDGHNLLRILKRAARAAGYPRFTRYLLRHTMATHAYGRLTLSQLAGLLGHADDRTTQNYVHREHLDLPKPPSI